MLLIIRIDALLLLTLRIALFHFHINQLILRLFLLIFPLDLNLRNRRAQAIFLILDHADGRQSLPFLSRIDIVDMVDEFF